MQNAPHGAMFALLGANFEIASQIARDSGIEIANDNAPSQQVLSGPLNAIENAMQAASAAGYKVVKLNVSGAFHSKLMEEACTPLEEALNQINISSPNIPIISNASGELMPINPTEIKQALLLQLTKTIQWCKSMQTLRKLGVDTILEVSPGTVYTNLVKRIDANIKAIALIDLDAINLFIEECFKSNIIRG